MKKGIVFVTLFLLNVSIVQSSEQILLKSRRFTPAKGVTAAAKAKIEAIPGRVHVLIQLEHIPTIKEKKELEAKGIKLLSYIPENAWLSSIPSDKAVEIAALSNVRAISEILLEDKISPHMIAGEFIWHRVKDGKVDLIVEFFEDVSLEEAEVIVETHKARVVGRVPTVNAVVVTARIEDITALAYEDTIKWVEQELPLEEMNDGSRAAIAVGIVQAPPYNLDGTDIDVLVYDVTLFSDIHVDFGNRLTQGELGWEGNHATHVAGTLGGDGTLSNGTYRGMAPAIDIISYYVHCPTGSERCLYDDSACMADMESNFNDGITTYGADIASASAGFQPAKKGSAATMKGTTVHMHNLLILGSIIGQFLLPGPRATKETPSTGGRVENTPR